MLSGTRMAHEGALYLIGHFRSHATLELTLHQVRVSTRVNLESRPEAQIRRVFYDNLKDNFCMFSIKKTLWV